VSLHEVDAARFAALFAQHDALAQGYAADAWRGRDGRARRYWYAPPATPAHTRLFLVDDADAGEIRMLFMTEDAEDAFFR
jgi:hypothetical protein